MIDSELSLAILELVNETLTATIVVVSVSILLYNLARDTQNRVARTSAIVLACVTIAYLTDVVISLEPGKQFLGGWLRFQWIGIAFIPAALFHLSDALLATTGRPSRGRRTTVVRICYILSSAFTVLALASNMLIKGPDISGIPRMIPGPIFPIYVSYLLVIGTIATINVIRARRRCLTSYTQRRMTYLLGVFLSPAWGIFPYSLLFGQLGDEQETKLLVILNLANLVVMTMLVFLAYPLSFFGSKKPDRAIKSHLLEFMLRGPLTGTGILAVILFVPRASNVLGLDGEALMPFAAVTVLLFLQWSINLVLPVLQRWLIYSQDQQRIQWIQGLGDRLLTPVDASQLLESILAAICDNLRVPTAFVAKIEPDGAQLIQSAGSLLPSPEALTAPELSEIVHGAVNSTDPPDNLNRYGQFFVWRSYWIVPLRFSTPPVNGQSSPLSGILGVWARAPVPDLSGEELQLFRSLAQQAAHVLEGLHHQSEVFVILEGLASQMDMMQQFSGVSRYGHVSTIPAPSDDLILDPRFFDMVRDALRNYWGGPKLTESELLRLNVVWHEMEGNNDNNPVRALRNVLARGIENLKPDGQRSLTTTEWILYNILEMRFVQGRKVRDVAMRLAISESDLYRKQRVAIEEVARRIGEMERNLLSNNKNNTNQLPDDPEQKSHTSV
jgi:hypothetical protein